MLVPGETLGALAGFQGQVTGEDLDRLVFECSGVLPVAARPHAVTAAAAHVVAAVLLEGQFGQGHFRLSRAKRLYYEVRPTMPRTARSALRKLVVSRTGRGGPLGWPVEPRFVEFVERLAERLADESDGVARPRVSWWPQERHYAVVLTHDVETQWGVEHVRDLMDLEEGLGFRSSIHFVGHDYGVPAGLLREIVDRGFELGIHGWHHDGKLFASRARFMREAAQVNSLAGRWRVNGFRSPMTHREPEWMQDLNVDWDSTFFDTDPYEPMGGGVMSIWPYVLGRFVELPSTMPQDHTLIETLRDPSPRLWLSKLDFIAQHCGMALLNTHPEYLCRHGHLEIYRALLEHICARDGEWRALPGEVASWTRERWQTPSEDTAQPGRSGGARMNVST